ncbi:hypothetical protein BDN71DRAFT_1231575 [Pleurotus eryngii]|uniref:Metallothionein n=1 Tax=Pleurotus eryngii TaxID=5323 RepID=A0A9P5ZTQ2_PLEER|nr:hypothetical protein BDN71DRAFT_1231575 [Pleurotus eryngii]
MKLVSSVSEPSGPTPPITSKLYLIERNHIKGVPVEGNSPQQPPLQSKSNCTSNQPTTMHATIQVPVPQHCGSSDCTNASCNCKPGECKC